MSVKPGTLPMSPAAAAPAGRACICLYLFSSPCALLFQQFHCSPQAAIKAADDSTTSTGPSASHSRGFPPPVLFQWSPCCPQVAIKAAEDSMSSTALSASRFAIAALAFAPFVVRGLRLPHVRRNAAELALWLFGAPDAAAVAADCLV